jgi:hypothetical protein
MQNMNYSSVFPEITYIAKRKIAGNEGQLEDACLIGFDLNRSLKSRGISQVTQDNLPDLLRDGVVEYVNEQIYLNMVKTRTEADKAFALQKCAVTGGNGSSYQKFCFGLDSPNTGIALAFWISSAVEAEILATSVTLAKYCSYVSGRNLLREDYVVDFKEHFMFMHDQKPVYAFVTHNEFVDFITNRIKFPQYAFVFDIFSGDCDSTKVQTFRDVKNYTKLQQEFTLIPQDAPKKPKRKRKPK